MPPTDVTGLEPWARVSCAAKSCVVPRVYRISDSDSFFFQKIKVEIFVPLTENRANAAQIHSLAHMASASPKPLNTSTKRKRVTQNRDKTMRATHLLALRAGIDYHLYGSRRPIPERR